ncbi:NAD-dependent epimerase/dehydratase family protein [Spirulina subsalsa FACHB-351]|uniref:NAD-dependent epimerase/dehydratase family protein n=1 Tax=Spirulina subsalsa FACHB-351 TaxID=234711 RepID=A0ABT3L974_9CYAN|nr:NAD-dependent epimerase/dehydratase family protein [Spirulina subsalsa]MCW6038012.1 NAD-dependent epimerase/dehydratase family protein [Spirulina subsalsa FACHB-351]
MSPSILLTGATGFTGSFVCQKLIQEQIKFDCLIRHSSDSRKLMDLGLNCVEADLNDLDSLKRTLPNYKILVNVASIGFGAAPTIVQACEESGIERAIFISTTAIFTHLNASSKTIRLAAEQSIKNSSLKYTILRPTMIYGTPEDRNMIRLLRFLQKSPIIPIFGSGEFLQQPVHVEDVAWAITKVINCPETYRKEYNISGKTPLTYNQVIEIASEALGKKTIKVHIPVSLATHCIKTIQSLGLKFPITEEQILRLNEHKNFDYSLASEDFGYSPRSFAEGIDQEIKLLK